MYNYNLYRMDVWWVYRPPVLL